MAVIVTSSARGRWWAVPAGPRATALRRRSQTVTASATTASRWRAALTCSSETTISRRSLLGSLTSGSAHEEPGSGLLADRPVGAVQPHRELARGALDRAQLHLAAGDEALVVEPVQELP